MIANLYNKILVLIVEPNHISPSRPLADYDLLVPRIQLVAHAVLDVVVDDEVKFNHQSNPFFH